MPDKKIMLTVTAVPDLQAELDAAAVNVQTAIAELKVFNERRAETEAALKAEALEVRDRHGTAHHRYDTARAELLQEHARAHAAAIAEAEANGEPEPSPPPPVDGYAELLEATKEG
jgi:hypothetical protein